MTTDGGGDDAGNYPVIPGNSDTSQGIIQISFFSLIKLIIGFIM